MQRITVNKPKAGTHNRPLMFWISGHLAVVRWQIQGLEEASQEEVGERRQPDNGAVVSGHHLLTPARLQHGRRAVRHTALSLCTISAWSAGRPGGQQSRGSVGPSGIHTQTHKVWVHPLWWLYIREAPTGCLHLTKQAEFNQTEVWVNLTGMKTLQKEGKAGNLRDCVFGRRR